MPTRTNPAALPRSGGGDTTVFISGRTWDALIDRLEALEGVFSAEDFDVRQGKDGKQVRLRTRVGKGGAVDGPFCKLYSDENKKMLSGGTVTGGSGNETVDDINLGSVSSGKADGTHHWLKVNYTATADSGVLLPGGKVTSVTDGSGASLPSNSIPTASSPSGTLYISLGSWQDKTFRPAGCGNFQISHCPGSLSWRQSGGNSGTGSIWE